MNPTHRASSIYYKSLLMMITQQCVQVWRMRFKRSCEVPMTNLRITATQARKAGLGPRFGVKTKSGKRKKKPKYGNKRVTNQFGTFDSLKEYRHFKSSRCAKKQERFVTCNIISSLSWHQRLNIQMQSALLSSAL